MRLRGSDGGDHDAGAIEEAISLHQRDLADTGGKLDATTSAE